MPKVECLVRKYDSGGGRKSGDIVSVKEIPHKGWGREEGPPNYVIVTVSDTDMKGFEQYKGRHVLVDKNKPDGEIVRSKYRFDLTTLPNFAELSGKAVVSKSQAIANVIDRKAELLANK